MPLNILFLRYDQYIAAKFFDVFDGESGSFSQGPAFTGHRGRYMHDFLHASNRPA